MTKHILAQDLIQTFQPSLRYVALCATIKALIVLLPHSYMHTHLTWKWILISRTDAVYHVSIPREPRIHTCPTMGILP
jgi:hypothetical protein